MNYLSFTLQSIHHLCFCFNVLVRAPYNVIRASRVIVQWPLNHFPFFVYPKANAEKFYHLQNTCQIKSGNVTTFEAYPTVRQDPCGK